MLDELQHVLERGKALQRRPVAVNTVSIEVRMGIYESGKEHELTAVFCKWKILSQKKGIIPLENAVDPVAVHEKGHSLPEFSVEENPFSRYDIPIVFHPWTKSSGSILAFFWRTS